MLKVSDKVISRLLRKAGAVPIEQRRLGNDITYRRPPVCALRDVDRWSKVHENVVAKYRAPQKLKKQ